MQHTAQQVDLVSGHTPYANNAARITREIKTQEGPVTVAWLRCTNLVLWREFNYLPAHYTRRAASFFIRYTLKTVGASRGSRGNPTLLGLSAPTFWKRSRGSRGRLSEGVQCRLIVCCKTFAKLWAAVKPITARFLRYLHNAVHGKNRHATRISAWPDAEKCRAYSFIVATFKQLMRDAKNSRLTLAAGQPLVARVAFSFDH